MEEQLQKIIEKVSELYMRYGIRSVTMDDVSRHLGISKKTLYSYVTDKQELVELTVKNHLNKNIKAEKDLKKSKFECHR
jgi:AcrR family transcriptional regulator